MSGTPRRRDSDSPAQTGGAIAPFVDQPSSRRPSLVFTLFPWGRPALWAPVVDAVHAARDFLLPAAEDVPPSRAARISPAKEPVSMSIQKAPAKHPRRVAEASPSLARLEAAVRKAGSAKAKARDAKAALKQAKKAFRVARKAAKAARKDVEALQAAIASAEERAAAAAKRARTTKPARKTRRAASSTPADAEVVYTEAFASPTDTSDASPSATSS